MPFFPLFFDPTFILIIIGVVISGAASMYVQSTFSKYSEVRSQRNISGIQAARLILDHNGLQDISIEPIRGNLTDHYSPQEGVLRLSDATRDKSSVAAISVAAHEAGHAVQDKVGYVPMRLRSSIVPVVNFGQSLSMPIILIGVLFGLNQTFINIGILLFAGTLLFQLVTLPVEFNASNRALEVLESEQILVGDELAQGQKVLRAAALTYVAGAIASFLTVMRLVLLFGGGRRD